MSCQLSSMDSVPVIAASRPPMDIMGKVADVLTNSGKGLKDLALEDGGEICVRRQHGPVQLSL